MAKIHLREFKSGRVACGAASAKCITTHHEKVTCIVCERSKFFAEAVRNNVNKHMGDPAAVSAYQKGREVGYRIGFEDAAEQVKDYIIDLVQSVDLEDVRHRIKRRNV